MKSNTLNLSILGVILQSKGENQQHESPIYCVASRIQLLGPSVLLSLSKMKGPENSFVIPPKISQLKRVLKLNENV